MKLLRCPCCKEVLTKENRSYVCANQHNFDIAKAGYVNLLLANNKGAKNPGDSKEMCAARSMFFSGDYYKVLREKLDQVLLDLMQNKGLKSIVDVGCGEGYYTNSIYHSLKKNDIQVEMAGFDISKFALHYASKAQKEMVYGVASLYELPLMDQSVDVLLDIFAPVSMDEFKRVLKPEAYLLMVIPAKRHLMGLKKVAYDEPYENEEKVFEHEGFELVEVLHISDEVEIIGQEHIHSLFQMTPYYFKTPKEGMDQVEKLDILKTEIGFEIHVLKNK